MVSYHSARNDEPHGALRRCTSTSSTTVIRKRTATTYTNNNVFRAVKRLLFSRNRQTSAKSSSKNYLIINAIVVTFLLVAHKLNFVATQAFGAGGYGGMPQAGTPGGNMFQQAMLLDLLDVNERMREAIMMQTMMQNGALGGAGAGGAAGGAYGMNPALGLTAGDPSLGAAFAAAAAQQVAAASLPQMQMQSQPQMLAFAPQPQQQIAPAISNHKTPYTQFDPLARYELQQPLVQQHQQQQQPQQQHQALVGGGSEQIQNALHQAYFAPLQSNVATVGALGLGSESNAAESGAGGPTILHRVPRATASALAPPPPSANTNSIINPRAGGSMNNNRVPFANIGGYQKKKKGANWATPAASLGARGHNANVGGVFKKKHALAGGPYSRQQFGGGGSGGGGGGVNGFNNHINIKHGKRRPRSV